MRKDRERVEVEQLCRVWLSIAAENVDTKQRSVYDAYAWAYHKLDGMAVGFLTIYKLGLYNMVKYYREVAHNKMEKELF